MVFLGLVYPPEGPRDGDAKDQTSRVVGRAEVPKIPARAPVESILRNPDRSLLFRFEGKSEPQPPLLGPAEVLPLSVSLPTINVPPPPIPPPPSLKPKVSERQGRLQTILGLIHYPWQALGYDVVLLGPRPGFRAMTISDRRRIEIYMRNGENPLDIAYDLAHELGHAFDLERNDDVRRARWCVLRGIDPAAPWFGCNRCPDYSTPAGDFAETFAYLLLGPGNYHSRMAPAPTDKEVTELATFCEMDRDDTWCAARKKLKEQQRRAADQ
jgi:hypothetical protein